MAGYAVIARIQRVDPHRAGWAPAIAPDWPRADPLGPFEAIDLVGRPVGAAIAERWGRIRETWAQTTFYLFDAESWR